MAIHNQPPDVPTRTMSPNPMVVGAPMVKWSAIDHVKISGCGLFLQRMNQVRNDEDEHGKADRELDHIGCPIASQSDK